VKPDDFAMQLASVAPSSDELKSLGLSHSHVKRFINSFICTKRDSNFETGRTIPILDLLNGWTAEKIEIGMVRLLGEPVRRKEGIQVGLVEADPLFINSEGEVEVRELGATEHVLWNVAQNGDSVLDALLIAANFLGKRAISKIDFDDLRLARQTATDCALAAGGLRYLPFYLMLLGAEP
jgi:hypothetical protein